MATQAERTATTTELLLEATVRTLIERGYRGTSTPEVCKRAGVSRGAQLHHYPTKQALVAAAVDHLLTKRVNELIDRLSRATEQNQKMKGVLDLEDAASFLWKVYTGDTFYAWLELVVAARTDPELRELVAVVDERLVKRAEQLVAKFLLPYVNDLDEVTAMTRLILAIFDGLATHRILTEDDALARRALRSAARAGLFQPKASTFKKESDA